MFNASRFLYLVEPEEDAGGSDWQGNMKEIRRAVTRGQASIESKMETQNKLIRKDMNIMNNQLDKVFDNVS